MSKFVTWNNPLQTKKTEDWDELQKFLKMTKEHGWKPMDAPSGIVQFGGKSHYELGDFLPEELDDENLENLDFLVVGWRRAFD